MFNDTCSTCDKINQETKARVMSPAMISQIIFNCHKHYFAVDNSILSLVHPGWIISLDCAFKKVSILQVDF